MSWWQKKRRAYPEWYQEYQERINLEGYTEDIIALDIETTSLNPRSAGILSYGAVHVDKAVIKPMSEIHLFFNTPTENTDNIVIHELFSHVSDEVVDHFLPMILASTGNRTLLGHYVEFDIAVLNQCLKRAQLPKLKNPSIDTLQLALKKDGFYDYRFADKNDYTLYALCDRYGIDVEYTHDALSDAYLTALLYLHIR